MKGELSSRCAAQSLRAAAVHCQFAKRRREVAGRTDKMSERLSCGELRMACARAGRNRTTRTLSTFSIHQS
jgi:hypothetical protein